MDSFKYAFWFSGKLYELLFRVAFIQSVPDKRKERGNFGSKLDAISKLNIDRCFRNITHKLTSMLFSSNLIKFGRLELAPTACR